MEHSILNGLKLINELGRGGMAVVYLAHDNKFDTQVAVKLLNKEYVHNDNIRKRFLAEARNMFRMSHPNIIKVTDLIDDGDTVAFVMEYIEGETLKDYLERIGKLGDVEIKSLFTQMLDAVGYVHEQNLVHRDIKPSNFMLDKKGNVKLLDFGIAKNTEASANEYTQTGTGMQMGTPMYMSPEQVQETRSVTYQSDIYSLAVLLWQMVTGCKPYDNTTLSKVEIQIKILKELLEPTGTFWDNIIQKCTSKQPDLRIQSCQNISIYLAALFNDKKFDNDQTIIEAPFTKYSSNYSIVGIKNTDGIDIWGISKSKIDWQLSPIYSEIIYLPIQEIYKVKIGGKWGLLDKYANPILEAVYSQIGDFNSSNESRVLSEGNIGRVNSKGEVIIQCHDLGVEVGAYSWMSNNLHVSSFRNGDAIPIANSSEEWQNAANKRLPMACYYGFDVNNSEFGLVYNWYAINDNRGLAPEGWEIPSDIPFNNLVGQLDWPDNSLSIQTKEIIYPKKISDFKFYVSGFTNLEGHLIESRLNCYYWTFKGSPDGGGVSIVININERRIERQSFGKGVGLFVRCVKKL
jgi:uncharacterized protein (TIGR02145 family)